MDTRELNRLAVEYVSSILTHDLSKAELIMLVATIQARIMGIVTTPTISTPPTTHTTKVAAPIVEEEELPPPTTPTPLPRITKAIKYDPMYDPPPPMVGEALPARNDSIGRVLAAKGTACLCAACRKVVYITNTDVVDGMKVKDFIAAYTPTDGMPSISKTAEIENFDGNIATDCPACQAHKKLFLTGGPSV